MTTTFIAAAELVYADLATLFVRAFANYLVPIRTSPGAMEARNRIEHVDLFASQTAQHGAAPVATSRRKLR